MTETITGVCSKPKEPLEERSSRVMAARSLCGQGLAVRTSLARTGS